MCIWSWCSWCILRMGTFRARQSTGSCPFSFRSGWRSFKVTTIHSCDIRVDRSSACNARVLKAYESQRRLKRNFLEGARKERLLFTPRGIYEAWLDLDAAAKVYIGTVVGLIISVRLTSAPHGWSTK